MSLRVFLRVNRKPLAIMLIVIVIASIYFLRTPPSKTSVEKLVNSNGFTKVTSLEEIPNIIVHEMKMISSLNSLKRGVWLFKGEKSYCYIMFCGGVEYKEKYDVEIESIDAGIKDLEVDNNYYQLPNKSITYDLVVKESNNFDTSIKKFDYPVVIFKSEKIIPRSNEVLGKVKDSNNTFFTKIVNWSGKIN